MKAERLASLDAFRGFTVAGMILVNNPGSWTAAYPQLLHAPWHGWTFTDFIFPFFLFIVGVSMVYSFAVRIAKGDSTGELMKQVIRRSAIIFAIGFFLNFFPNFNLSTVRIPGVLQRIAVCYLLGSVIVLNTTWRGQAWWLAGLLVFYYAAMTYIPVPDIGVGVLDPGRNLSAYLDQFVLTGHMWVSTKTWDPEGLFSTIPAIGTTLCGVLTGHLLLSSYTRSEKAMIMIGYGIAGLVIGHVMSWFMPINKSLWTSSYVVFMAGWALIFLAVFYYVMDIRGWTIWAKPFTVYGLNALIVFAGSGLVAKIMGLIKITVDPITGRQVGLKTFLFDNYFAPFADPLNASLLYAIAFNVVFLGIAWGMHYKKWYVKI
jgi:predicted acyltransferase